MFVIVVLSFIPVIIWSFMMPLGVRFLDLNSITTSIGQILGLFGMALFSINLILAGRFKFLDKYFKGLDNVYVHHSKIGALSFLLLLFHPIFLVVKYIIISTQQAASFFIPFTNIPNTWGIIALLMMIILMCLTFYIKLKYHIWKMSHKLMVVAFFFAVLHTFFVSSDVSRSDLLRYYILLLALIGLAISIRKAFLDKYLIKKFQYKVKKIDQLNKDILEIEMEPVNMKMTFNPGQFSFFSFISESVSSESHPFSISSSSDESNLKIIFKNFGDFTNELKKLKVGDSVLIDGPYGNFSYKKVKSKNQIWIAGGIGITPFLSMIQNLDSDYHVDLYYAVKEEKEAVHIKDLEDIRQKNPNFKYNLWISSKFNCYLTGEAILNLSKGLDSKDIFLCGPPLFMKSLEEQFILLGVDIKRIHYENFNFFNI